MLVNMGAYHAYMGARVNVRPPPPPPPAPPPSPLSSAIIALESTFHTLYHFFARCMVWGVISQSVLWSGKVDSRATAINISICSLHDRVAPGWPVADPVADTLDTMDTISYPMFVHGIQVYTYPESVVSHEAVGRMWYDWFRVGINPYPVNKHGIMILSFHHELMKTNLSEWMVTHIDLININIIIIFNLALSTVRQGKIVCYPQ